MASKLKSVLRFVWSGAVMAPVVLSIETQSGGSPAEDPLSREEAMLVARTSYDVDARSIQSCEESTCAKILYSYGARYDGLMMPVRFGRVFSMLFAMRYGFPFMTTTSLFHMSRIIKMAS